MRYPVWCLVGIAAALTAGSARADAAWVGGLGNAWVTNGNWSTGVFPGTGSGKTGGSKETATLGATSYQNNTLDLAGLGSIWSILLSGADAPAYTVGTGSTQTLVLEDGGSITADASLTKAQAFAAAVQLGATRGAASYTLANGSGSALSFYGVTAGQSGTLGNKTLYLTGSGDFTFGAGGITQGSGAHVALYSQSSGTATLGGSGKVLYVRLSGKGGLVIPAGVTLKLDGNAGGTGILAEDDATISGDGTIDLSTGGNGNDADNAAKTGKTLTIACKLSCTAASDGGFEYWGDTGYLGTIVLSGANDFPGNVHMNAAGTLSVDKFGMVGSTDSSLGKAQLIYLRADGACLRYTGAGETSDRTLVINLNGTVEQSGTGRLILTKSPFSTDSKTLTLQGSTGGVGEFACALTNTGSYVLSITKAGTGTWVFSDANTYTGGTALNAGTLELSGAGRIAASAISIAADATLHVVNTAAAFSADRIGGKVSLLGGTLSYDNDGSAASFSETIPAVAVSSGSSTIAITPAAAGQTVALTIGALTRVSGTQLNVTGAGLGESDTCRLFITGQADGTLGAWLTVNGSPAAYSSSRGLYAVTTGGTDIAARGPDSVVPNDASAVVAITTEGTEGAITLAGDSTNRVMSLTQKTAIDATVSLASDKMFQTGKLAIDENKAGLTIGASAGEGTLTELTAGDGLILQNDSSNGVLTVQAVVTNNAGQPLAVLNTGSGTVRLTQGLPFSGMLTLAGGTLAAGFGGTDSTLVPTFAGPGTLAKEGTNTLTFATTNSSFTGTLEIRAGRVMPSGGGTLGTGSIVIKDGATFDFGLATNDNQFNYYAGIPITAEGSGWNGNGAIQNSSSHPQYGSLNSVTLSGDTVFGSRARWSIASAGSTRGKLDLGSHTATILGDTGLSTADILNPGKILVAGGTLSMDGAVDFGNPGETGSITLAYTNSASGLNLQSTTIPIYWPLICETNSILVSYWGGASSTNANVLAGPIQLNGTVTLKPNYSNGSNHGITLAGKVSGPGGITMSGGGEGTEGHLLNTANDYTGDTTVQYGLLIAYQPSTIPNYSNVVCKGGALDLIAGDATSGWTAESVRDLIASATFNGTAGFVGIDTRFSGDWTYPYDVNRLMGLQKNGAGALTLTGSISNYPAIRANVGELRLTGTDLAIGELDAYNGSTVRVASAASLILGTNSDSRIGNNVSTVSRMILDANSSCRPVGLGGSWKWTRSLNIGPNGNGIVEINDGVTLTNKIVFGYDLSYGAGAIYQHGGDVVNWCGGSNDGRIGYAGYGYYELQSGTYAGKGYTQLGTLSSGGGILAIQGGTFRQLTDFGGGLAIARGGYGYLYQTGGTFISVPGVNFGEISDSGGMGGYGCYTLAGANALASVNASLTMGARTNFTAILNLNAGTLEAVSVFKTSLPGIKAYVNFDGGTYRIKSGNGFYFNNPGPTAPDAVTLFAGGAVFDSSNFAATVSVPLVAPSGKGVSAIAFGPKSGYVGPPIVKLSGDGYGASAIADFDSASGTVKGILVTSPGCDYTTASATVSGGGITNVYTATVTLSDNSLGGGLTKLGTGSLTLSATNTYEGATVVKSGTLIAADSHALPAGSDLLVLDGVLNLGNLAFSLGKVSVSNGTLAAGSLTCTSFDKIGDGTVFISTPITSSLPVTVQGGTLRIIAQAPGLRFGTIFPCYSLDTTTPNPGTETALEPTLANTTVGWGTNTTYVYTGYVWNRASTNVAWTFAESIDDATWLKIDNTVILNDGTWSSPTYGTYTLTPGAHPFEARFYNGSGGAGPASTTAAWWTDHSKGFVYDTLGRNSTNFANYAVMHETGDGQLFTQTASVSATASLFADDTQLDIASGAVLELGGTTQNIATLNGAGGTISNGTLVVGSGWTVERADLEAGRTLVVDGNLSFGTNVVLTVNDLANLVKTDDNYALARVSGTVSGTLPVVSPSGTQWSVYLSSDGHTLKLGYPSGSRVILR